MVKKYLFDKVDSYLNNLGKGSFKKKCEFSQLEGGGIIQKFNHFFSVLKGIFFVIDSFSPFGVARRKLLLLLLLFEDRSFGVQLCD